LGTREKRLAHLRWEKPEGGEKSLSCFRKGSHRSIERDKGPQAAGGEARRKNEKTSIFNMKCICKKQKGGTIGRIGREKINRKLRVKKTKAQLGDQKRARGEDRNRCRRKSMFGWTRTIRVAIKKKKACEKRPTRRRRRQKHHHDRRKRRRQPKGGKPRNSPLKKERKPSGASPW